MPRLSKKAKQEWDFFINPKTGRRTYNSLCLKCENKCKQSHKAIVVFVRSTNPKEVQKALKIAVNMMTAVNLIYRYLFSIKCRYKRKNYRFRHLFNTKTRGVKQR